MIRRNNIVILAGFVFSVSLLAVSITAMLLINHYNHAHMQALGEICQKVIEKQPEAEQNILEALKEYKYEPASLPTENIILSYGYRPSDFWKSAEKYSIFFSAVGFLAGGAVIFLLHVCFGGKRRTCV